MKKLFAILAIFGLMSVGLPTILSAQDAPAAPAVEETAPAALGKRNGDSSEKQRGIPILLDKSLKNVKIIIIILP